MSYVTGSEMVNFADGTSGERWYVAKDGHPLMVGIRSADEAQAEAERLTANARHVRIRLTDGTIVRVPSGTADQFLGLDEYRNRVYRDRDVADLVYAVTPCCQATGKGSIDSFTGVVCRNCYRDVPSYFGGQATVHTHRKA